MNISKFVEHKPEWWISYVCFTYVKKIRISWPFLTILVHVQPFRLIYFKSCSIIVYHFQYFLTILNPFSTHCVHFITYYMHFLCFLKISTIGQFRIIFRRFSLFWIILNILNDFYNFQSFSITFNYFLAFWTILRFSILRFKDFRFFS